MIEKKIRFTNYDKYDRRKTLKKFLDGSYLRHKIDDEEDTENFENDPVTSRFVMATQSSYGRMMDGAMKTFVTTEQGLSNVEIRGKNDPKPKIFTENPNSFALFFKDLYKFNNRNPKAKAFSKYLLNKYIHLSDEKKFREKVEKEKCKLLSQGDGKKKVMMMMMNLMIMMIGFIEMRKIKLHLLLKLKEPEVEDSEDEGKKEADSSLHKHYEKIESTVNKEGRRGEEIDDDFAPLDEQGWLMYSGGQENAEKFEGEVRRRQLTSFVNNELVDYLKILEGQNVLQSNRLSIHIESGEILLDDRETDENFYEFLELQINENKRLITTALRFLGSLKAFFENYLTTDIGTEEQWELDTGAFICSKFLVANYNSEYLIFNGKDPIYCKHTRAAEDDDMFETMNEIIWHEFLNSSIEGASQGAARNDNQWIKISLKI